MYLSIPQWQYPVQLEYHVKTRKLIPPQSTELNQISSAFHACACVEEVGVGGGMVLCCFIICVDTRHRTILSPSSTATTTLTSIFSPCQPPICSSFSNFVTLRVPYKWNHTTHNPLKLTLFIQYNSQRFIHAATSTIACFLPISHISWYGGTSVSLVIDPLKDMWLPFSLGPL